MGLGYGFRVRSLGGGRNIRCKGLGLRFFG